MKLDKWELPHHSSAVLRAGFVALLICGSLIKIEAFAQAFPSKTVRMVTGAASGGVDTTLRLMTPHLTKILGQPVIVENKGGGSGLVSIQTVMSAAPDGHTLLYIGLPFWIRPLMETVPYDAFKDFLPISHTSDAPLVLVAPPSLGINSLNEFIALAKSRPGQLNYGSSSTGSSNHLAMELLASMTGIKLQRVSYKGGSPAVIDVMGGRTQAMFVTTATALPHIKAGKLKAIAVTSKKPSELAPGVPTAAASVPGYSVSATTGLFAPAKTAGTVVARLNKAVVEVLNKPDVKKSFLKVGAETVGSSPRELTETMRHEVESFGKVIREIGMGVQK